MFSKHLRETKTPVPSRLFNSYFPNTHLELILPRHWMEDVEDFPDETFIKFAQNNPVCSMVVPRDLWVHPDMSKDKCYEETAKYWIPREVKDQSDLLTVAQRLMYYHLSTHVSTTGVLSTAEVLDQMELSTSPGYPYNRSYPSKSHAVASPEFKINHEKFEKALQTEMPIPDVFMSTLKSELRKKGKNPRTFMTGGLHMHVEMARLYLAQHNQIVAHHERTWFGIGLSPFHGSWHRLAERLINMGGKKPVFVAADVSGWDRDVPPILLEASREVMFSLLPREARTPENEQKSKMLERMNTFGPVLLPNGEVVLKTKGMPSGTFITIFRNTQAHMLATLVAFLRMIPKADMREMLMPELFELMFTAIWMSLVGDDEIGVINTDKFPWFDAKLYTSTFNDFGFTMKIYETQTDLKLISGFLSCQFFQRYGRWVAKPNREKVLCQVAFGGRNPNIKMTWLRVQALRLTAWPDAELYAMLTEYARFLRKLYWDRLMLDDVDFTTPHQIETSELTTPQIADLHLSSGRVKLQPL